MAATTERTPLLEDRTAIVPPADDSINAEQPADTEDDKDESTGARVATTIFSMWIVVFLAAMDSTLMATISAPVANDFDSFQLLSWLASAYLIATAAVQPLCGRLTEIFGRKAGLLLSAALFGIGNLICGIAYRDWVLIIGRVVSGAGGGGLFAIQTIVTTDLVPLRKRGLWQGIGNIVFGMGGSLGGVFGGFVHQKLGWRYAFLLQVPVIFTSTLLIVWLVHTPPPARSSRGSIARIDFLGASLIVWSLLCLLVGLNTGGNTLPWTHPLVLVSLTLAGVLMFTFVYVEDKLTTEPIIRVRLLLDRTVAAACITNWFTMMTMYATFFYIPIYLQLRGLSAAESGTELAAQGFGGATGAMVTGLLIRRTGKYFWLNVVLVILFIGACVGFLTLNPSMPIWVPAIYLFCFGTGYGGMFVVALLALIAAVDQSEHAIVTAASYVFRSTGSTIGVTIASAVFQNALRTSLWAKFGKVPGTEKAILRIQEKFDLSIVPPDWRDGVRDCYSEALKCVFTTILILAVVAAAASIGMREKTLNRPMIRRK